MQNDTVFDGRIAEETERCLDVDVGLCTTAEPVAETNTEKEKTLPFNKAFVNSHSYSAVSATAVEPQPQPQPLDKQTSRVQVYQIQFNNQLVMKRANDHFWNISSVLRMLSLPKSKRKSILQKFKKYSPSVHLQTEGFYAFQGVWISQEEAEIFCKKWNCYKQLQPLFER